MENSAVRTVILLALGTVGCAFVAQVQAQAPAVDWEKQKAETLRLNPGFSTEAYVASLSYKNAADREHLRDSLHKAGLPA